MALVVDSSPNNLKHFCKICKKGFLCGRALGGHMHAHGIGEDAFNVEVEDEDEDDPASDWEDKMQVPPGEGNKRMYALRTNPNRLRSCRACENCGKEFLSWKSFLQHGKCSSEDAESLNVSSPSSDYYDDALTDTSLRAGCSKRKRSFRNHNFGPLSEEEDLANCLIMLSNAVVEDEERHPSLSLIAPLAAVVRPPPPQLDKPNNTNSRGVGMFECKACKKVFNSHQALGGHRASHKKVKGCFAAKLDNVDRTPKSIADQFEQGPSFSSHQFISKRKSKVHECSICHRVFSSGQALGGHKRCHWITPNSADASFQPRFHNDGRLHAQESDDKALDLNIPVNDPLCLSKDSKNVLSLKVSTDFFLHSWGGVVDKPQQRLYDVDPVINEEDNREDPNNNTNNNSFESLQNVEDEADSKAKLAKLSELRDINTTDGSSPWLQVGIGPNNGADTEP